MSKRERDVAAAPAASTPLVEARAALARVNRERCYRMQLRQLNVAFARAVEENAGSSGSLENEVRQYIRFARQLTESFRDVLQPAAPAPPRGGSVYVVGTGDFGQLGLGDEVIEKSRPVLLDSFGAAPVIALACGGMHSLALNSEGQVYSWGVNDEGALGRELPVDAESTGGANQTGWTPGLVQLPDAVKVVAVGAGDSHSVALTEDGCVYGWGAFRDKSGAFGFKAGGPKTQQQPVLLFEPRTAADCAVSIACGVDHVLILSSNGALRSLGCAEGGRLGRLPAAEADIAIRDGPKELIAQRMARVLEPALVPGLGKVVAIAAGFYASFAIVEGDGESRQVFAWGLNNYGQLGFSVPRAGEAESAGSFKMAYTPRASPLLSALNARSISSGEHHTLVLAAGGVVYSCGRPTYGRLGRQDAAVSSDEPEHEPKRVEFGEPIAFVAAGVAVSAAVAEGGALYVWGYGDTGQLGKGADDTDEIVPLRLPSSRGFPAAGGLSVSLGGQHAAWLISRSHDTEEGARPDKKGRKDAA